MKVNALILLLSCLFLSATASENIGKVSFFVGKAKIKSSDSTEWKEIKLNERVSGGSELKTERSERVEITLRDGSLIRIAEESEITLSAPSAKIIAPSIKKGKIWANVKKLGQRNYDFEVTSGTATAAIRGTVFRMDETDSSTSVAVYDGKVAVGPGTALKETLGITGKIAERKEISGPVEIPGPFEVSLMDWVTIAKGQRISIMRNGKYAQSKIDSKKDNEDDWVKFNMRRDSTSGLH